MAKELKFYNGRPHGRYLRNKQYPSAHFNIAAYSKAHATHILKSVAPSAGSREIYDYYADCWGNDMKGFAPTEPGLWVSYKIGDPPTPMIENVIVSLTSVKR